MYADIVALYTDMVTLYTDILALYADIVALYADIVALYADIVALYADIVALYADSAALYTYNGQQPAGVAMCYLLETKHALFINIAVRVVLKQGRYHAQTYASRSCIYDAHTEHAHAGMRMPGGCKRTDRNI